MVAEPLEKHILSEKKERKSYAKTAGLKSAFAVGDSVYLTSFGRGNKARLDTKILADNSVKKLFPNQKSILLMLKMLLILFLTSLVQLKKESQLLLIILHIIKKQAKNLPVRICSD